MYVCLSVCTTFAQTFRNRLRNRLAQSCLSSCEVSNETKLLGCFIDLIISVQTIALNLLQSRLVFPVAVNKIKVVDLKAVNARFSVQS